MRERTHIDLFTGLGGFSLAARENGIRTEVMCEYDERCQRFLRRTYPDVPIQPDVRTFDGTKYKGRYLLTAGVPCQPASRAGHQRGKSDDRWLWPETLRIVSQARPTWCLFENPTGIEDVGIEGILADLETQGFEVGVCDIPACAKNSPQIRHRFWIIARNMANPTEERPEGHGGWGMDDDKTEGAHGWEEPDGSATARSQGDFWRNAVWLPCGDGKIRRAPDRTFMLDYGVYAGVHQQLGQKVGTWSTPKKVDGSKNLRCERTAYREWARGTTSLDVECHAMPKGTPAKELGLDRTILGALGNSIVHQVAAEIIRAMITADETKGVL